MIERNQTIAFAMRDRLRQHRLPIRLTSYWTPARATLSLLRTGQVLGNGLIGIRKFDDSGYGHRANEAVS
jgi:hypothetical protein